MSFFKQIEKKVIKKINPENIVLVDNSHLHTKHKFYNKDKIHLKIIIKSKKLKKMNKVKAHKEIYKILKDEMVDRIHALEIEIN